MIHPGSGLPAFAQVLANGTGHVATYVDSITYGATSTDPKHRHSWPARVARLFSRQVGHVAGPGVAVPWNTLWESPGDDPRWTFGDGVVQLAGSGQSDGPWAGPLGRGSIQLTTVGGVVFRSVEPVPGFVLYFWSEEEARVSVLLGGETHTVLAARGPSRVAVAAGTPTNEIQVSAADRGGRVALWGVEADHGAGIRVSNLARSGTSLRHLTWDPADESGGMAMHFDQVSPDLAVLMVGMNDRPTSSRDFRALLDTALDRLERVGAEVLLVAPPEPDYTVPVITAYSLLPRRDDLVVAGAERGVPLLDLAAEWGPYEHNAHLFSDGIHPNDLGLERIAQQIHSAINQLAKR